MSRARIVTLAALALVACSKPSENIAPVPTATAAVSPSASASSAASAVASTSASTSEAPSASASSPAALPNLRSFPGTEAGARSLLAEFVRPGADIPGLSKQLRPTTAEYTIFYDAPTAARLDTVYSPEWDAGRFVVAPRPGQTNVRLVSATFAELKGATGNARDLPRQYKIVAKHFVGNATVYAFHFLEPGKDAGDFYDGLLHVGPASAAGGANGTSGANGANGHWVLIPKPWRGLDEH